MTCFLHITEFKGEFRRRCNIPVTYHSSYHGASIYLRFARENNSQVTCKLVLAHIT